ncbi:amidase signature domain-containing protein [Ustulina deusta]|nr:amidase signature domain-containing protein [Ustulina deusta]
MPPVTVTIASGATWEEVAADRQRHRDITLASLKPPPPELLTGDIPVDTTGIPKSILTAEDLEITERNVEDLASMLASGQWSAKTVIQAFMRRASLAQQLTNCVAELLPEQALKRAAELDDHLAATGQPIGPLHGVPISVKEHIGIKGYDLNAGFVSWVGRVAKDDAYILQILWSAGAVFYVRTTQPQTLMHLETSNNLYGTTVNPHNTTLTAGGSSGGEGALVGLRGSVLGIGTDIGGSIRSPAANNGVFGFKPTALRLPVNGWSATMAGADHILGTIGPLSTSLEGVSLFVRTILRARPWLREPSLVPVPWKDEDQLGEEGKGRKLRVGVIWDDGVVRPHPPVAAALSRVVEKLRNSDDVEIVNWECWKHDLAWEIIAGLYFCDGGAEEKAAIHASGEPLLPLSKWILLDNPHVQEHTIPTLWQAHQDRDAYRASYAALWNERAVDVILCPAGPGVAPKLGTARYWGYTSQWNLLNYPAIVFPTGIKVGPTQEEGNNTHKYPADYKPMSEADGYNYSLWREHGVEGYAGAPVSLQLVGRMYEDEKLLRALDTLLDAAGLAKTC